MTNFDLNRYKHELRKLQGESKQVDPRDIRHLIEDCGGKLTGGGRDLQGNIQVEVNDAQTGEFLETVQMGKDTVENTKKINKGR